MTTALAGIRVVEMTSVVLGPYACQMLGDLGADVIKIEPIGGDTNRNLGPHRNNSDMSALFLTCNRNKRSVSLDLKSSRGKAAAMEIIKTADVVVHNFRPAAMERLGLDYECVKAVNPEVIYCATYGYSKKGPYGDKGALDDSIQAASGIAMLQSMSGGEPRYLPTIIADKTTALMVVQGVLAALFHKQRSGEGQEIEVPMFESMVSFIMTEHLWGQTFEPPIGKAGYVRLMANIWLYCPIGIITGKRFAGFVREKSWPQIRVLSIWRPAYKILMNPTELLEKSFRRALGPNG